MSFDEVFDLTAGVCFNFCNMLCMICAVQIQPSTRVLQVDHTDHLPTTGQHDLYTIEVI